MPEADPQVRPQDLRDLLRRAHGLVLPRPGATVPLEELLEDALRLRRVVADDAHPGPHGPLDLRLVAPHLRAVAAKDFVLVLDVGEPITHVAGVRVLGNGPQRALLAPTANQQGQPALNGRRLIADGVGGVELLAGRLLAVEHAAHDSRRLIEPAQPLPR